MGNVESSLRLAVTANEVMEQSAVRQAFEQWQSCNHLVTRAQLVINAHADKSALSGLKGGGRSGGGSKSHIGSASQSGLNSHAPSQHQQDHHDDVGHNSYVQRSMSPFQSNQSDLGGVSGFGAADTPRSHSPYGRTGSNHSRPDTIASRSTAAPSAATHTSRGGAGSGGLSRSDLQQGVAELRALQQLKNHDGDSAARTYELCCMVYGAERGHVEFVSWMSLLPTDVMNTVAEYILGSNHPSRSGATRVAADAY